MGRDILKQLNWQFWFAIIGSIVSGLLMVTDIKEEMRVNKAETALEIQALRKDFADVKEDVKDINGYLREWQKVGQSYEDNTSLRHSGIQLERRNGLPSDVDREPTYPALHGSGKDPS